MLRAKGLGNMKTIERNIILRSLKIAGFYSLFGLLWILFSDRLLLLTTGDPLALAKLQTVKGWGFIIVTAILLYFLVRRALLTESQGAAILVQSEGRFRSLVNTIPDLIWLKDAQGRYLSCNSMFERFAGYTEAELLDKTDFDIFDKELAEFFRIHDSKAIAAVMPTSNEEWIVFSDTQKKALLFTIKTPMYDHQGEIVGVLGIGRDITALRQAEEDRLMLENQLHHAKKIESIGRLAGGVAHDFNNMLGVIIGRAEIALLKLKRQQEVTSDLEEICSASRRSAELTRQLLTFARKQVISPRVVDINAAISQILKMLQRLIGEPISLVWEPGESVWPVRIDPTQADQILTNLCVNSRDAIDGSGTIILKTENRYVAESECNVPHFECSPGDYLCISVKDDGPGIAEEIKEHIFEPFYTTKSVGSGTGLGLATVFGAVKQNGGFIRFQSEEGDGTEFQIYLPRVAENLYVESDDTAEEGSLGNGRILLVEDDQMLLYLKKEMLEEAGYHVLVSDDVDAAIELARSYDCEIHLLISDLVMPKMTGKELSEIIMNLRPKIKVLLMSGYASDIITSQDMGRETFQFLQKPISFEVLKAKIRSILG